MKTEVRDRGAGRRAIGWSLLVLGLGAVGAGAARRALHAEAKADPAPVARELEQRVGQALAAAAAAVEAPAQEAAAVHELGAARKMGADRTTFRDLLENEEWWAPYRARFPLSGVVLGGALVAPGGTSAGELGQTALVLGARARGVASGLLSLPTGAPFLAASARIGGGKADDDDAPLVLLGTPLDQAALQGIAGATGDVVAISDGAKVLAASGPPASRTLAGAVVGHEAAGPRVVDGDRVAVARPLGARAFWIAVTGPGALRAAAPDQLPIMLFAGGGLVALLGLVLRLTAPTRPLRQGEPHQPSASAPAATPAPVPMTPARLSADGEALAPGGTRLMPFRPDVAPEAGAAPAAAAAAPALAETRGHPQMGRYHLIERIGEGGMAEIFFAAAYGAEDFVRYFVVKRLHAHLSRHREVVNHFIDEARLQSSLVHSNIVPVFDFGKAGEEYFLALEYIHGRDVSQIVNGNLALTSEALSVPVAFFILHEVLDALAFAHGQTAKDGRPLDIVHRDVAPGNVLVSYGGEVRLTDFGIAKAERRVSHTEVGMVKGNVSFMSPEQARGETVDARTDIFAAGLVLYYCLTGHQIYRDEPTGNRLLRAAVGPATAQFNQIDLLPPDVARVLRRALASAPADRYQSAAEFQRDTVALMGTRRDLEQVMARIFPPNERRDLR
jgi:hypothetical protein